MRFQQRRPIVRRLKLGAVAKLIGVTQELTLILMHPDSPSLASLSVPEP